MAWNPFDPYGTNTAYASEDEEDPYTSPGGALGTGIFGGPVTQPQQSQYWEDVDRGSVTPPQLAGYQSTPMAAPPTDGGGGPAGGGTIDPAFLDFWQSLYGLSPIPQIGEATLPENPQINEGFSRNVNEQWQGLQNNANQQIGEYYNWGDWPTMQAAQFESGNVPRTTAQTPQSFEALDFLLSGQGFDPATLARINAGATDSISREAMSQRGAAKIRAEQAGLTGSGADMAIGGQIDRRAGDARTEALNKIAIEDATMGVENKRIGSGMELQRRTTEADMVNQNALEQAAREFAAMSQNVNNQQQANQTNTQNQYGREMTRAGKQADFTSGSTGNYQNAALTKAADAETQNAANTINRNLNNAQFGRQREMFNTGIGEGRYSQALGGILGLAGNSNPSAYNFNYQYQPNLIGANAFSNLANSFLNPNRQQNQN